MTDRYSIVERFHAEPWRDVLSKQRASDELIRLSYGTFAGFVQAIDPTIDDMSNTKRLGTSYLSALADAMMNDWQRKKYDTFGSSRGIEGDILEMARHLYVEAAYFADDVNRIARKMPLRRRATENKQFRESTGEKEGIDVTVDNVSHPDFDYILSSDFERRFQPFRIYVHPVPDHAADVFKQVTSTLLDHDVTFGSKIIAFDYAVPGRIMPNGNVYYVGEDAGRIVLSTLKEIENEGMLMESANAFSAQAMKGVGIVERYFNKKGNETYTFDDMKRMIFGQMVKDVHERGIPEPDEFRVTLDAAMTTKPYTRESGAYHLVDQRKRHNDERPRWKKMFFLDRR